MATKRLRIVVIVRCPLCGGWIVGNSYSEHLEQVHLGGPERGLSTDGCGPGAESPWVKVLGPETGVYGLDPIAGPFAGVDGDLNASEAGQLLTELGRRWQQGQDAALGFLVYE